MTPPRHDPHDTWVAIDFETATRHRDSACALGLAVIRDGELVERASWLIRPPGNRYEYWNTRVHGIRPADTESEPTFAELWPVLLPYLEGAHLLAHNASFDVGVLRALVAGHGLETPESHYVCTVLMARRAFPELHAHKLDIVCDHCGIVLNHHEAESDAVACATIALRCREALGAPSIAATVTAMGLQATRL
ncbi:MAG: 3'-5' exonuclease [Coriobacteriia bacterium]|nr:3'-5' exonuclease [Coriobacteriia bacterium]